ncbi:MULTISPECIES: amidase [Streptomyces]|uniref:Amidase n=1 Tax=Streptomyces venezuelae (strain ATCC 10712 / CBS 650.69 / DSM 40230 / JCM 4526 / NBRC 13096 / PD 04745) TaxID=953739 RepID=F2RDI1_STRVP|nr:amidase [Streptomyces venezuelae]APE24942.1 amidase [Streptomyces venezuelae]QES02288.1 amidase [Streptomyces venezuelae ATCC 10712]CCA59473.1 Amidase [Streptomyces venezuelae ATCC 10712]
MNTHDSGSDLAYLSATEARRLFDARELSPVELMRAVIDRAEQTEPVVNAFTERLFEEALEQARHAEDRFLGKGGLTPRPLEGIPVATKEKHAIAGRSLTEGSLVNVGATATENAPVIDRILEAGGIIHARTATPEFSIATFTHSRLWGVTRNPWNPDLTPGGSSGGAGASLAAGSTLLASASDIGGSTRIPAAFTGTVGFKAPYGRIPGVAPLSADHYRGDGPMARTVDDCVTFANVLAGPDPRDHVSLRPKLVLPTAYAPVAGMRLALCLRLGAYDVHPEVEAATRAVARALTDAGAVVEEIELPWTRDDLLISLAAHFSTVFGALVSEVEAKHRDRMTAYAAAFADTMAEARERVSYLDGLRVETRMQRELAEAMAPFDALICPTTAVPGLPAGDDLLGRLVVNGVDHGEPLWAAMTAPFNISNRCPVLNVPSGRSSWGVPTGVQIVGHTYDDPTVFRVGKALERLRPWAYTPDRRPPVGPRLR